MTTKPKGRKCSVCGKPCLPSQGDRHLSCSPVCNVCFLPIAASDVGAFKDRHSYCTPKWSAPTQASLPEPEMEVGLL